MRASARCDVAAGCLCGEGEAAASCGPAVGGTRARRGSVLLQKKRKEARGGHGAPPQRLRRTHTHLVQHPEGAAHR